MSRFLRFCAFLSVLFFTTNVFAAGYSCPTYKKYTSCSAGYYMTNSSGTTYNGTPAVGNLCTICPKGYYCTGGTANKVACSAGRYGSSTGLRTSACSGVIAAGRYGSAGATSANGSGAVSAGYYSKGGGTSATPTAEGNGCLSGYKCGKVSTGCYGSAGATTDCPNSCPAGYQAGAGTTAQSNCLASCAAGSRVATANAACTAITSGNVYMLAHTVKYGQTSEEATRCPSSYTISGTTQADHDAKDDCKITCSAGTRVTTADATCSSISSSTGYYITSHTVSAGLTSPAATQCPENYRTGAGTTAQSNCLASCSAGYAVLTENSACTTIQNSTYMGKYTTAHTVKYGDTSTISTCPPNYRTGNGAAGQSNCLASCSAGYAVLTENSACTTIQNSTYMGKYTTAHVVKYGDTSTISTCPGGYRDGAGTTAQSNCLASCAAGSRVATANAACSAITSGNVYMLAHTVKYGATSATATSCPSSYTISGTTQADHDAKSDCKISCNAGYAVLTADETCSTIQNSTYKGKYTASHTVSAGSTSTISTCPANYQTGNGAAGQANCTTSCAAGSRVATANAACSAITSGNVYMLAHTVKYGETSATATSCPSSYTISGTTQADHDAKADCKITCDAGYAVLTADETCSTIQNSTYKGKYTASHTVSAGSTSTISTCPTNYQTGNGAAGQANCTTSCAAGSRVATANEACSAITSGNVYMLAHTVKYGATSAAATSCPSSYTISGTTQADHDAKSDCKITCSAGTRVTTADATCSSISGSTGYYITSHTVSAGSTSPAATQCPENYRGGAGTTSEANCSLTTTAGKYVATAGAGETACISPYYCPGGTTIKYGTGTTTGGNSACTALGAIYSKSDAGASAGTSCYATTTSTKWVASAKASSESTCTAGYYCAGGTKVYYNSTGGRTACGGGKYSAEGATSCSNITAGCYGTSASSSCPAVCAANSYSNAGASACTACDSDYANSGDTAASHAGVASCKVTCAAGTYVASSGAACTDVGSGYYTTESQTISQGSTGSRSACSSLNAFYTASDSGRNATTDCFGTTTSGKFVKTAKSGEETCTAGGYCPGSVKVYYNSTGGRTACGAGTKNASTGSSSSSACTACAAGTYNTTTGNTTCSSCPAGSYCTGGSNKSACAAPYSSSAEGSDDTNDCYLTTSSTKYVAEVGKGEVTCAAGGYCPGGSTIYRGGTVTGRVTTGGRTACGAGKYNASTGSSSSSACANITAGCYGTSASSACPAVCGANKYSDAGASSCTSCPTDYKNSGDTATAHAGSASCIITVSGGYYIGTAGDNSSNWDKCAGGTYKASHTVAYGSTSSCATCSAGYYCPEGASGQTECGGNTKYSSSGASACSTVSTGYYTTGGTSTTRTGQTKCEAGNYCASGVKTACGGGKYSAAGATSCSNITAGCYGTSASSACPAVCAANKWSAAGASSCTSCPTDYENSGDTAASHANQSSCKITVDGGYYIGTAGDNSSNWDKCSAGYYKAAHSVAYGSTSSCSACGAVDKYSAAGASACSTVDTGYYTTGGTTTTRTGQSQCKSGTYCTDGVQNTCPSGYGASAAGSDAAADCYMSVAATKYVKAANDSSASACGTGTYKAAHTVYYGGTSTCSPCPSGYDDGAAVATQAECVISVAGGKYVGTANSATLSTCAGGTYKASHTVAYGSTSSCGTCPANSYCPEGASAATACSTLASGFYPNSAAGSDAAADCYTNSISGKYVASKNATSATSCAAGTYKGSHQVNYGSTSSCGQCPENSYCPAGASAATACSTLASGFYPNSAAGSDAAADCYTNSISGKYVASKNATSATNCAAGTFRGAHIVNYGSTSSCDACALGSYSAAGASACTACQSGKTTSGTGKSSCDANCGNNNSYASTWATATWSDNAVANLCQIATCAGGSKYTSVNGEATGTLPSGYTQLAYLESTGTQAIDTNIVLQTNNVEFEWTAVDKSTNSATSLFGSETYSSPKYTGILYGSNTSRALYYGSITGTGVGYSAGAELASWKLLLADTVRLYKNDVMVSSELAASSLQKSLPIAVFANNLRGSMKQFSSVQMYSFKILDGGNLVLNLIPAMRDSDGVLGMYDTVNNRFLVNAGSGTFVAGPANLKFQNTCTQCSAGTYSAGGTETSCGTCPANSYCPAGASAATACSTLASGFYPNSAAGSGAATDCKTNSLSGKYVASANATSATTCSCGTYKEAHTVAYGSTSSCTTTSAGYYAAEGASSQTQADAGYYAAAGACEQTVLNNGCYGSAGASTACPNNCNALTAPAVTGGTFSSVTPRSANTACRYVAPSKTYTGCSSITANTVSYSGTAWGTDFYTTKASKGYRVTATGNTSAPACTACACGTYQETDGSTTTTCTTTSAGYYAKGTGNSSQTQASAGYYAAAGACDQTKIQAGCFGGEGSASACPNSCPAAESGWTLASTTGLTVVTDCAEITTPSTSGSPIATICTAGTLTKKATNSTTWGSATASGLTAKAGRYVNGTTCSACEAGTYTSSATTATSCTPAATGYYVNGTEATSQTACPAGTYGSTTGLTSSACSGKCTAGYYCPAASTSATQNECTAGNYCPAGAGAETSCATVGGKLYVNSAAKSDAATDCYISLASKVYLASATSTSTTTCTAGYYCPGGNFYYSSSATNQGRSSCTGTTYSGSGAASCSDCPSGYTANTESNKTAASQCQISCAAGTQVATANAQCTTPSGNWYTTASQLVNYGKKSTVSSCPTGTITLTADMLEQGGLSSSLNGAEAAMTTRVRFADYMPVSAGTYTIAISDSSVELLGVYVFDTSYAYETLMSGAKYTFSEDKMIRAVFTYPDRNTNITVSNVVSAGVVISKQYSISGVEASNHDAQTDCQIVAPAGTYVASAGKMFQACVAGAYKSSGQTLNYGSTNSCSVCGTSTYSNAGASSCTACTTAKGYTNSGTTAASHAGAASCKVTCGAGQYVASAGAGCVNVGVDTTTNTGYWGAGGTVAQTATLARNKCDTGLITTGSGTGANEAADCGRKLHAGDNVIYLRSAERTSPSLRVKVGDKTFFGALSTALSGALKVKNGSTTYSVVNDWQ